VAHIGGVRDGVLTPGAIPGTATEPHGREDRCDALYSLAEIAEGLAGTAIQELNKGKVQKEKDDVSFRESGS
jgi:hypothetical protein